MKQITILLILMLSAGCGIYSVSGSMPAHIKTVAVPLFENETVEVDMEGAITSQVIDAIIRDGNMKVVSEFQADALVDGTIVDVIDEAGTFTKDEKAEQFKIRIFASVSFFDRKKNSVIWEEKHMEGWAMYDAKDPSSREQGIKEALEMLAKEIIDKTVSGW
jgi:hypothetical protein